MLLPPPPCTPESADAFLSQPTDTLHRAVNAWQGTVLVLGAGGKMGLHVCLMLRLAVPSHVQIIAVSRFRSHRDQETFQRHGLPTLSCDLSQPEAVAALPEASVVFFLAGVKFGTATAPELLHRMNVTVPQLVAERFARARIVALSTGCVYPFVPVESGGATETTPPAPIGAYAESCLRREEQFRRASERHGTAVVLIRLNYAVEFRYGVLVDIARKVHLGEAVDVTMGHVNLIWQRDAVETIIRAEAVAAAPARPLNVTGVGTLRVRELAHQFGQLFGVEPRLEGTEAPTAWLNDASESHRRWGPPPTDLATMQRWIAAWLAAGYPTWDKPTGFERRDGRF